MADVARAVDGIARAQLVRRLGIPVLARWLLKQAGKGLFQVRQIDPILGAFGTGHRRLDIGQVEFQNLAVAALVFAWDAEHVLGLEVASKGVDLLLAATGCCEIPAGLFIDREKAHGCAIFRGHIGNRGAVGQR